MVETITNDRVRINLISYIGLLKVYYKSKPDYVNIEHLYDVKLIKSRSDKYFLQHPSSTYKLISHNGLLKINQTTMEVHFDNIIGIVDLEIKTNIDDLTSIDDFNNILSKLPKIPFSGIDRIFYSFRSALTKKINTDRLRTRRQLTYSRISSNTIKLDEVIENAEHLSGTIGSISIDLKKAGDYTWELVRNQNIPVKGTITFTDPTNNYEYNIFKHLKFRRVLNDPQIPSSPLGRIRSFLTEYDRKLINKNEFKFRSDHQMTEQQGDVLNRLISDPLIIVDSVAGTGKTTTVVNAILELIRLNRRTIVIAHSHRVLEAIIEMLKSIDPTVKEDILRIATKNTKKKVMHKKFLVENIVELEKQIISNNLKEIIRAEEDEDIKIIQKNIFEIIQSIQVFSFLVALSKKIVICTADSLLSQSRLFYKESDEIITFHPPTAEFDLAIIEDSSDINFPTLIHSSQFSRRWAFIGDMFQSAPVVEKSMIIPKYKDRKAPRSDDDISRVTDLLQEKNRTLSVERGLNRVDHLLGTQALNLLKDEKYFDLEDHVLNLRKWHRNTSDIAKFIVDCFQLLKGQIDLSHRSSKNIPIDVIEVIDSHSSKLAEEINEGDLGGYTNTHEIILLIEWLENLLNKLSESQIQEDEITIGIYSPFNAQIELITKTFVEAIPNLTESDRFIEVNNKNITIHVNSLHNHKNREYDIMILMGTRSYIRAQLKDEKDMFTIISRAKQSLVFGFDVERYRNSWRQIKTQLNKMGKRVTGPWGHIFKYIDDHPHCVN